MDNRATHGDRLHGAASDGDSMSGPGNPIESLPAEADSMALRNVSCRNRPKSTKPKRSVSWANMTSPSYEDDDPELRIASAATGTGSDLDAVLRHYGFERDIQTDETTEPVGPRRPGSSNAGHTSSEHSYRLTAFGLSLSTAMSDVVLVYPCLVLRRQCQVSNMGQRYHFTPFTIIGVAVTLQRSQGLTCLWKGVGSHLMISALSFGVETGLSEASTKLPREVHRHSRFKDFVGHIILKSLSTAILLPFYSAHLVESIQSEKASDSPGLFFFITEGLSRLFGFAGVQSPRMLPFRHLVAPTVLYFLFKYVISSSLQYAVLGAFRYRERRKHDLVVQRSRPFSPAAHVSVPSSDRQFSAFPQLSKSSDSTQQHELVSLFLSQLVTDVLLYPFETVIYRLHVQGTRTIIDDMDRGSGFLPVSTRYEGFFDCWNTSRSYEGSGGLYRGFGALILQYAMKFSVLKLMQFVLKISGSV